MQRKLKIYSPFTKAGFQDAITYKLNFLGFFLGEIFYYFVMYFIWKAVFNSSKSPTFMSFTLVDMVMYLFVSNITRYLVGTDASYSVGEEIRDGSIVMRMIKPVNYDLSIMFFELGQKVIILLGIGIPMLIGIEIYRYQMSGMILFSGINLFFFLISILLAYLLNFYLNICMGFAAFYLKNLWGFNILKDNIFNFLSGAIIPLAFMPKACQTVLNSLPFASLSYTPVMIYMGKYQGQQIFWMVGLQVIWLILIYGLSKLIWKRAVKHLTVQGG